jgi:hypothetical protein
VALGDRRSAAANELEIEADLFEAQCLGFDAVPALPPLDACSALLAHMAVQSRNLLAAAMRGDFSCVYCSAAGPHADASQGGEVAVTCVDCGKSLGALEVKWAVFATLARVAAQSKPRA